MKKTKILLISRVVLLAVLFLGLWLSVGLVLAGGGGNRCTDRCADVYRLRKDACRAIPLKHERHRCEQAAKRAKKECKRHCR